MREAERGADGRSLVGVSRLANIRYALFFFQNPQISPLTLSVHHFTSINMNNLPGNEGCVIRSKEHVRRPKF